MQEVQYTLLIIGGVNSALIELIGWNTNLTVLVRVTEERRELVHASLSEGVTPGHAHLEHPSNDACVYALVEQ